MPTYRAYLINGDNRVTSYKPVEAETDAEAMKAARSTVPVTGPGRCRSGRRVPVRAGHVSIRDDGALQEFE